MRFFGGAGGSLSYEISTRTAFDEIKAPQSVPYIEGASTYGLIPANFREFTATGGSAGVEGRLFKVSTGTSVGGYGAVQSFRSLPHRAGQGVTGRFSGYFASNAALSWQGIGFISLGEEMKLMDVPQGIVATPEQEQMIKQAVAQQAAQGQVDVMPGG